MPDSPPTVRADQLRPLRDQLRLERERGTLTRDRAVELVRRWVLENMPALPSPGVDAVAMDVNGRLFVRATISVTPLCMDVLVSQETTPGA